MKIAVMQPYFFPYIGYFQLINAVDKFVVLDDVNFIKKGWIARNRMLVGKSAHLFNVRIKAASQFKKINMLSVDDSVDWRSKLCRTVELSYKKAPHFSESFPVIEGVINYNKHKDLGSFLRYGLKELCRHMGIKTDFVDSSAVYENADLKAQERIRDICAKEGASQYFNLSGGRVLYDREFFRQKDIDLNFIKCNGVEYRQFGAQFMPDLSIIDVMMFNSRKTVKDLLSQWEPMS